MPFGVTNAPSQFMRMINDVLARYLDVFILMFLNDILVYYLGTAAGGVFMQDQGAGPRPIAFMSRALKPTEQRYLVYERELAAIAYCFIQWRHYLEGCPGGVTVITDHQPLTHLMEQQVLSRLQSQWLQHGLFQSIQTKMVYQQGKANIVADALSRSWPSAAKSEESTNWEQ